MDNRDYVRKKKSQHQANYAIIIRVMHTRLCSGSVEESDVGAYSRDLFGPLTYGLPRS